MSTNARQNRVKMAVAALTILTATAARVLQGLSGRYTVRCNLAEIVIRGSSYKDSGP